ncbi:MULTISPECIES: DUF3422 family protein [unclassified Neptuniibacter]|uniref:DUF3422 family protein n=1 Tax=unclassified Neptuniibacter TaxID=2630693 RepID=UPI0026E35ABB|nr:MULTISPECIES: DUF3422 domain-containing protein [unclassified Neptuniibacter]MDO6513428.1 DUF3422 domain-containing protein [Neptuniibacter sp. 2_MG-2023]MDO6593957.1 DUF3422 domain-containing protein [Neptuniibacter sp. 1_MG-2023]
MQNHPLRNQITQEVHARPFQRFKSNLGLVHIAAFYGAGGEQELSDALSQLLSKINVSMPETVDGFFYVENDLYGVRYEPHNEFYTLTLYQLDSAKVEKLTGLWESLPGELLCGVKIFFSGQQAKPNLKEFFGIHQVSGAEVMGGAAKVWTDFYPDDEMGFVTMVVHNTALKTFQAGRLLQRLCEIETYRHTALLAYPIAQALMPQLTEMDQSLSEITHEIATNADAPELLKRLMALAADVEALSAETANRFSASQAYFAVVDSRIAELREERIVGLQTVQQFMDRRLDPAKRTCIAANERLERLSRRIARATELIRSQVDLSIERQNQQLLEGLNDRARRQLRLQAKLESFTIIVVTYYAFDLLERSIRNTVSADILRDQVLMVLSCSVPIMAGVIWWYVRKLLKHYGDD